MRRIATREELGLENTVTTGEQLNVHLYSECDDSKRLNDHCSHPKVASLVQSSYFVCLPHLQHQVLSITTSTTFEENRYTKVLLPSYIIC